MPEDKHPWRKEVQERIEEYLIFVLRPHEPLETTGFLDELTAEIAQTGRAAQLRKALRELTDEYRTVVEVLDFKKPHYATRYPSLFPNWPRGRRKGLQQLLKVAPSTLEDWYAKALDQMAESMGLKEASAHRGHPRVRKAHPTKPRPNSKPHGRRRLNRIGGSRSKSTYGKSDSLGSVSRPRSMLHRWRRRRNQRLSLAPTANP